MDIVDAQGLDAPSTSSSQHLDNAGPSFTSGGATSEAGRSQPFWTSDAAAPGKYRPLKIHLPLYLPDRATLRLLVIRNGGLEERLAKSDVIIIDTETQANSVKARELFRQARGLPRPLPCVSISWIVDSIKAGIVQNVRNSVYDPVRLLDELEKKEERKKRIQEMNGHRQAAMIRSEIQRNPGAAELHEAVKLPGKRMYTAADNYNIVEHLAVTKSSWQGGKVADELVAKYGTHTRWSYQSYLRDNLEKGALLRPRVEEYLRTGINPIKITPRLRLVGSSGFYVGNASSSRPSQQLKKVVPSRNREGSDGEGFEEDDERSSVGEEDEEDPIINSSAEPSAHRNSHYTSREAPPPTNGRLKPLGAVPSRGVTKGYRPHGAITRIDADADNRLQLAEEEVMAEDEARLARLVKREEKRPADEEVGEDEEAKREEHSKLTQRQGEIGLDDRAGDIGAREPHRGIVAHFTDSERLTLIDMTSRILDQALQAGYLCHDELEGDDGTPVIRLLNSCSLEKGKPAWRTLNKRHPNHEPDEWADHWWKNLEAYAEAAKTMTLSNIQDVTTQQLQATQADAYGTGIDADEEAAAEMGVPVAPPQDSRAMLQDALSSYIEEEDFEEHERLERPRSEADDTERSNLVQSEHQDQGTEIDYMPLEEPDVDGPRNAASKSDVTEAVVDPIIHTGDDDQRARHHDAKAGMTRQGDEEAADSMLVGRMTPSAEVAFRRMGQASPAAVIGAPAVREGLDSSSGRKRSRGQVEEDVEMPRRRRISSNAAIRATEAEAPIEGSRSANNAEASIAPTPARASRSRVSSTSGIPIIGSHSKIRYLDLSKEDIEVEEETDEESQGEYGRGAAPARELRSRSRSGLRRSEGVQGEKRASEVEERTLRTRQQQARNLLSPSIVEQPSRRQPKELYARPSSRRVPSSHYERDESSGKNGAQSTASATRLDLSISNSSRHQHVVRDETRSVSYSLEKEEAKLALQRRCLRLAKKYGFSSIRQVTPFISAAGLDTVKGEALILRRLDDLAQGYDVQRDVVIQYVREADGSLEVAEKFLRLLAEMTSSRSRIDVRSVRDESVSRSRNRTGLEKRTSNVSGGDGNGQGDRQLRRDSLRRTGYRGSAARGRSEQEEEEKTSQDEGEAEEEEEPQEEEEEEEPSSSHIELQQGQEEDGSAYEESPPPAKRQRRSRRT